MAVSNQDLIELDSIVLLKIISEVRKELLVTLGKVTWIYQRLDRASSDHEAVSAAECVWTWISNMYLYCKICQTLPCLA